MKSHPIHLLSVLALCQLSLLAAPAVPANLLAGATSADWVVGSSPPSPWQHSDSADMGIVVRVVKHAGTSWIRLVDDSTERVANLRQNFDAISSGRLTFRIALNADHTSNIGIYLGVGNASAPEERVVELKTASSRGVYTLGTGGYRVDTAAAATAGLTEHHYLEFIRRGADLRIRFGRITPKGTDVLLGETLAPNEPRLVSRLRITTDSQDVGAHFLISDLVLTSLD